MKTSLPALLEAHNVLNIGKVAYTHESPDSARVSTYTLFAGKCSCGAELDLCPSVERLQERHHEHREDVVMDAFAAGLLTQEEEDAIGWAVAGVGEPVVAGVGVRAA